MVPLMMHNVISLPVPSQPGAQLLARAAKQPAGVNPACTSYAKDTKLFFLLLVQNALGHTCFYIIGGGFSQVPEARVKPNVSLNSKG